MEGATVLARFKERPDWVGLCARDDLPRCSPRLAKAVADARTHVPGRRRSAPIARDAPARTTPHRQDELLNSPDCRTAATSECAAAECTLFRPRRLM